METCSDIILQTDIPDDDDVLLIDLAAFIKTIDAELLIGQQQQQHQTEDESWTFPSAPRPASQQGPAPTAVAARIEDEPSTKQRGYEKLYRARVKVRASIGLIIVSVWLWAKARMSGCTCVCAYSTHQQQ